LESPIITKKSRKIDKMLVGYKEISVKVSERALLGGIGTQHHPWKAWGDIQIS
jgi:hypothetical protein